MKSPTNKQQAPQNDERVPVSFQLPADVSARLNSYAEGTHRSKTAVVIMALVRFFDDEEWTPEIKLKR